MSRGEIIAIIFPVLKIVIAPNPILAQKAKPVTRIDNAIVNLISEMKKTLEITKDPIGVGLAAPQVGKSLRIFIAKPTQKSPVWVFVNPKIQKLKEDIKQNAKQKTANGKLEGCLSLPNIWGNVSRASKITLYYTDQHGKRHKRKLQGFMANIIQHEVDHLDGILFTERVLRQKGKLYKSHKNEEGEDEFEELEI